MRVVFSSVSRPKRVSKFHVDATGLRIQHAQNEVAFVLGYKDWDELQRVTNVGGEQRSPDDEALSDSDLAERRAYQVSRLVAYRRAPGRIPLSTADAERIIDLVRPSALTRPQRGGQDNSTVPSPRMPEALRALLREAELRGAHKIHVRDVHGTATVRYRRQFDLTPNEAIGIEDATAILDWSYEIAGRGRASGAPTDVHARLPIENARVELVIDDIPVEGGRNAVIAIRQVGNAPPPDMLGFAQDQRRTLVSFLDSPGLCIVSGALNRGTHTTARALAAARPDIPYIGEIRDETMLPSVGIATMRAGSAIFALERLVLPHTGRQRADLARPGALSVVSHQYLLPVLCPHCSIPADRVLTRAKCGQVSDLFGLHLRDARVNNPEGCAACN